MNVLPDNYLNRVVNDDLMAVLRELPDECVDMIYGDPDYNAGISYDGRSFKLSWDEYVDGTRHWRESVCVFSSPMAICSS